MQETFGEKDESDTADGFEDSAVEKITQFENGTITDILALGGDEYLYVVENKN